MIIGVPKEVMEAEYRVAMTPVGVRELTAEGHRVLLERDAGAGSSIPDVAFERAGAELVRSAEDVWERADLILKVKEPQRIRVRRSCVRVRSSSPTCTSRRTATSPRR